MKRMRYFCFIIAVVLLTLSGGLCTDTYAAYAKGAGFVDILPGGSIGWYAIAESYSSVSPIDDYEFHEAGFDWAEAETYVSTPSGEASSWAMSPHYLVSYAGVWAEAEAYGMDRARAWAGAKVTETVAMVTKTMTFQFVHRYELDLPPDSDGYVQFYVAFWEGSPEEGNLLLTPKDEWGLVNLGTDPASFYVLSKTLSFGTDYDNIITSTWPVPYVAGREYSFYAFVDADAGIVPEPTTILLLGLGAVLLRRR